MELTRLQIKIASSEHVGSHGIKKPWNSEQFVFVPGMESATELREIPACILTEVFQN